MPDTQPTRLPLLAGLENRGETPLQDARLVNGYVEQIGEEDFWVYKRPGLSVSSSLTAGVGRGVYNWGGNIYAICGNTLYKDGVAVSGTVDTTNGTYTFDQTLGATPRLFFQNGVKGYNYDSGAGLVQVSDADYPAATVKGSGYLSGTTYVMTAAAAIHGSGINDTTSWDPLNKLVAQIEPDGGVGLGKQLVYIIAFKQWSTEIFYDANAAGSPLGRVQGAKISMGCRHQDTIREIDGVLLWVGVARSGSVSVMLMSGLKAVVVSTPSVEKLLQQADYTTVYSWTAKVGGHRFYALTLVNSNLTLVYDMTSRRWAQWTDASGNYLPIVSATFTSSQQPLLQHASNGKIYLLENTNYTDDGAEIPFDLYTPNYDGGTRLRKYLKRMDIIADQVPGSFLHIRCSEDDYKTWSHPRTVDLSTQRPALTDCGTFRRRAYHFRHTSAKPLRIKAAELQLDLGVL